MHLFNVYLSGNGKKSVVEMHVDEHVISHAMNLKINELVGNLSRKNEYGRYEISDNHKQALIDSVVIPQLERLVKLSSVSDSVVPDTVQSVDSIDYVGETVCAFSKPASEWTAATKTVIRSGHGTSKPSGE